MAALPRGIRRRGEGYVCDVQIAGKRRTGTARTLEDAVLPHERLARS